MCRQRDGRKESPPLATAFALLGGLLLLAAQPAWPAAKYPPGPPYRSCPDTLKIYDVQQVDTLLASCHPATGDTVLGIKGIVTGFDAKPSAYAVYFQARSGGPFSGIQAFTGATNYNASPFNLAIGDSIAVYGTTQEFPNPNGTTEIEGPDVNQSTNDIVIGKISSGNPLPPFQIVTTHDMNWVPGFETPVPRQEKWEACLVRLRGSLRVGRTSAQGGSPALPANSFLVVSVASPAESVLVDGNTLTTFVPPSVGTTVDSVQGIVNQNTLSSVNSYRVQLRDGNDIFLAAPPNLVDAYPIEDNQLRLVFDRNLDPASAQLTSHYSLGSTGGGSTVNNAALETNPGAVVILGITSVLGDGNPESVTVHDVGSESCPTCVIFPGQTRAFVNGVLTVAAIQQPDPAYLPIYQDRSRFAGPGTTVGTRLTFRGVVVNGYGSLYYLADETGALRGGVSVFGPSQALTTGHRYRIAGQVQEFGGETEVVGTVLITDEGVGTIPAAVTQTVAILRDTTTDKTQSVLTGEDYEGTLVQVSSVRMTEHRTTGQSFRVAGPSPTFSDTILVANLNGALDTYTPPDSGQIVTVTGILHCISGTFELCARGPPDITGGPCEPQYQWQVGPSIKIARPIAYWPDDDLLHDMRPGDGIAISILGYDSDDLQQTCVDCAGQTKTTKWGPYADAVYYDWTLQPPDVGTLILPSGPEKNTVIYEMPKCWSYSRETKTVTVQVTLKNLPSLKAIDAPVVGGTIVFTMKECDPTFHYIDVTASVTPGIPLADVPTPEGGTGRCVPLPPVFSAGAALVSAVPEIREQDELCPDYMMLYSVDARDTDSVVLKCKDQTNGCEPSTIPVTTTDPRVVSWSRVGQGEFPLGTTGPTIVFRRSRSDSARITCYVSDSHTQFTDPALSFPFRTDKAILPRALVAVGDNAGGPNPLRQPDDDEAAKIAKGKYEAAGYQVDTELSANLGNINFAFGSSCYQAVWILGHGSTGSIKLLDGRLFVDAAPNVARAKWGCRKLPFLREFILLGCDTDNQFWESSMVCGKAVGFTRTLYSVYAFGTYWYSETLNWERDEHRPLRAHNLAAP